MVEVAGAAVVAMEETLLTLATIAITHLITLTRRNESARPNTEMMMIQAQDGIT